MVAETQGDKVLNKKEGGAQGAADTFGFKGGVVGASRNVTCKSSKQFGGTVEGGMRAEEIGKEIETAGFEIASSTDRRCRRHRKLNRVCGTTES